MGKLEETYITPSHVLMWRPKSCVLTAKVHTIQEVGRLKEKQWPTKKKKSSVFKELNGADRTFRG